MELSKKEWNRIKNNAIVLKGKYSVSDKSLTHIYYSDIHYGKNLRFQKKKTNTGYKHMNNG